MRVLTFGTFDLFHIGHLRILERAAALGDELVVGVSSDELNFSKKGHYPVYDEDERMAIVAALRCVSHVFREDSLELKRRYLIEHRADLLVMGDDWRGRFDEFADICQVRYLERTPNISTTLVKAEVFHKETHARRGGA
ncbi:MAG TPA: adenylyltransferase/cytidyltransferase family protein [Solimonas sp.]|nr:adenylyltransferase/cytidyltransferase family protein [Solimonas sp.]